jgi:hypothetical protein
VASPQLERLFSDLLASQQQSSTSLPPVHLWHPPLSGDIDILVDRQGRWIHEGGEIKRSALVKLFASILVREEDQYFLVTPVEKWRIKVDIAPLFIVAASREVRDGVQAITLTTSTGDTVVLDKTHALYFESVERKSNAAGELLPLVVVRNNIPALVGRNVYYELIEWALESSSPDSDSVYLSSMGEQFLIS